MPTWNQPHISKIYEALTALADNRIELDFTDSNKARCYSSSRDKFYELDYDPLTKAIMSNDNSAFWNGQLSYPMLGLLMMKGEISYNPKLLNILKGIKWKKINQKFKNDYDKALAYVKSDLRASGENINFLEAEIIKIQEQVKELKLEYLGSKRRPPKGF